MTGSCFRIVQAELSEPASPIALGGECDGLAVVARWRDRPIGFAMIDLPRGAALETDAVHAILEEHFALSLLAARFEDEHPASSALGPMPSITAAICTKDRPKRLARLLSSLQALPAVPAAPALDVLVVDNAPSDDQTLVTTKRFPGVRYVLEPKPGLNFGRNKALAEASGEFLAFLDDDVVVDPYWRTGLMRAWRGAPNAGAFTGLVLPFALNTPARVLFERQGGFGRGFKPLHHGQSQFGNHYYPAGAGIFGAGCNMAVRADLMRALGGFDEALDTGRPLPGGGDLDLFYRVIRSGHSIVYEPSYAVYHEHRESLKELRRQYWTWGLGFMAFLRKCMISDAPLAKVQMGMLRWWFAHQGMELARALAGRSPLPAGFVFAEFMGGIVGIAGEYERSRRRVAAIKNQRL